MNTRLFHSLLTAIPIHVCAGVLGGSFLLLGCGPSYHIVQKNSESITIEYDELNTTFPDLKGVAEAHCQQYGKRANSGEPFGEEKGGIIYGYKFQCE